MNTELLDMKEFGFYGSKRIEICYILTFSLNLLILNKISMRGIMFLTLQKVESLISLRN
jgi:hypothetical protein